MKERTKAYMAGLMDGEGNFTIRHHPDSDGYRNYVAQVVLYNTYRPVMNWVVQHFGGAVRKNRLQNGQHKTCYMWTPQGAKHTSWFLSCILPYLQIKKEEAKLVQTYLGLEGKKNPEGREELRVQCSELKQRDSVTTDLPSFSDKQNLTNAYFAGLFDGEGHVSIKRTKMDWGFHYAADMGLTNTYLPIVRAMIPQYGGTVYSRKRKEHYMTCHSWNLSSQEKQEKFLLHILPYLIIKRDKAKVLLEFVRLTGNHDPVKREKLYFSAKKIQSELASDDERESAGTPNS